LIKLFNTKWEESIFSIGDLHPIGGPPGGFGEGCDMIIYFKGTSKNYIFLGLI